MRLLERAANEQFFDLSVGQGFERLLQPYHSQSASTISLHQPVHLFCGSSGFLLLKLRESGGQNILLGSMKIEFHYLHHRDHFLRQLFPQERNHHLISGEDDVTYFVFTDDLSQALDDLFGVLLVRVPYPPLVAGLRPSTHLDPMNLLAFYLLRIDDLAKPEDEDARRVRVGKHRGVSWVLLIEAGEVIQMRLVVGVDAVIADRGR